MTSFRNRMGAGALGILLVTIATGATAQVAVYGSPTLTAFGVSTNGNSAIVFKSDSGGLMGGMFYNFPIQSRFTAGIDLRLERSFGSNGGNFETAAFRIGLVPHEVPLRPYLELGGGAVSTSETLAPAYTSASGQHTSGGVEFLFGLDVRVTKSIDVRAIEFGAVAGASSVNAANVSFADVGIVYHFNVKKPKNP